MAMELLSRLELRVPPGLMDDLDALAAAEDRTRSYVVRRALSEYVARHHEEECS